MSQQRGICTNYRNCQLADGSVPLELRSEDDFVCPQCEKDLMSSPAIRSSFKPAHLVGGIFAIIAACLLAFWYFSPTPATANAPAAVPKAPTAMLRFAGSNTIGSELLPALAEAYMKQQGITDIKRLKRSTAEEISLIDAKKPSTDTTIEIASHGSSTAFKGLSNGTVDIGMSSRKIKPVEISKLAIHGDMTAPTKEHVLALDGIAIIVNRNNPITTLTKDQIAAIFAGVITDWAELKRAPGAIKLYARDNKSGTYDTFESVVLNNLILSNDARLFEDSVMLSDKVAADPDGIGFVGLPFVKNTRALAVSESNASPLLPNRLTIATEDYPLARRLYLYTPDKPDNPHIRKFTNFVLSNAGQDIVRQFGFIELNVQTSKVATQENAPDEYTRLTSGAQRLTLNFRFKHGSHKLDNKSVRDLDRVIDFVEKARSSKQSIMLFGFSDSVGDETINLKLSNDRAKAVAEELARRGVTLLHVSGYGSSLPVASNRTPEGRERNRRVEI